ncbi:RNA-binding protein, partial [Trypanosoma conorhini]
MPAKSAAKASSPKASSPKGEKKGAAKAPAAKTEKKAPAPKAAAGAPKAAAGAPKSAAGAPKPAAGAPKPAAVKETKQRPAAGSHHGVYVKNWGQGSVDDAKAVFSGAGNVVGVRVRRRRYAIVFFENAAAVKKAIDLFNEKEVMGSVV